MFFDNVRIHLKAGDGGNGCVSFHREKYISHGGPDGGDGGNGGNIIFKVDKGVNTLTFYKYKRKFIAENGANGQNSKYHGKNGKDLVLLLPEGTVIKDPESGLVIKDMTDCDEFVIAKGGRGGWGNKHFATPTRQIPRFAKSGLIGEEKDVLLELKMIADVGFVGFPNVGKSSLLSMISAAKPKVADYHFTTLAPNIGVVEVDQNNAFVAADIPGLIEGAADGAGLGHDFLRHVERCRLLVHIIDISGSEGRDPSDDFIKINNELFQFNPELAQRPQIVAANKSDLECDPVIIDRFEKTVSDAGYEIIYISAATGKNVKPLIKKIHEMLTKLPPIKVYDTEYFESPANDIKDHEISIRYENGVYFVEGEWLCKIMRDINFDDRESLMYFQRILRMHKVIDKLEQSGINEGDTVDIYEFRFEFIY